MKHLHLGAITLSVGLLLSACGGGSGAMNSMIQSPPEQPATMFDTQSAFGTADERPNVTPLRYRNLVTGLLQQGDPAFGSVAMNLYTPGLAPVRSAETTFTSDRFTLRSRGRTAVGSRWIPIAITQKWSTTIPHRPILSVIDRLLRAISHQ